jgi:DNA invertase Pin-like site-specific DNA recombinase
MNLIFGIFAALAEFEADLIREPTKAGLAAARARGRVGGRPRLVTPDALRMAQAAMADPKSNATEVAKRLGVTRTTLYDYVNGDGSLKEKGKQLLGNSDAGEQDISEVKIGGPLRDQAACCMLWVTITMV